MGTRGRDNEAEAEADLVEGTCWQGDMGTRGEAERQRSKIQWQKFRAGEVKGMRGMHDPRIFIR